MLGVGDFVEIQGSITPSDTVGTYKQQIYGVGLMISIKILSGACLQIKTSGYTNTGVYVRSYNYVNGTWNNWKEVTLT